MPYIINGLTSRCSGSRNTASVKVISVPRPTELVGYVSVKQGVKLAYVTDLWFKDSDWCLFSG